jgi:hypothetical protein
VTDDQRDLLALLGYFYLQNARPERAEAVYAALAVLVPAEPQYRLGLACAQVRAGKPDAALSVLDRLLEMGHLVPMLHLIRAQALVALDRQAEARRAMSAFVAAMPARPDEPGRAAAGRG